MNAWANLHLLGQADTLRAQGQQVPDQGAAGGLVVRHGAHDRASYGFLGLTNLGLEIGILYDFLCSVLLFHAILG